VGGVRFWRGVPRSLEVYTPHWGVNNSLHVDFNESIHTARALRYDRHDRFARAQCECDRSDHIASRYDRYDHASDARYKVTCFYTFVEFFVINGRCLGQTSSEGFLNS